VLPSVPDYLFSYLRPSRLAPLHSGEQFNVIRIAVWFHLSNAVESVLHLLVKHLPLDTIDYTLINLLYLRSRVWGKFVDTNVCQRETCLVMRRGVVNEQQNLAILRSHLLIEPYQPLLVHIQLLDVLM
jgi:hypothetical protein